MPGAPEIALAWIIVYLAAALEATIGFGFAVVSVPLLTLIDPVLTPIPQLFLELPMALAVTWRDRHHLDTGGIGWAVSGRVPGALLGAWVLSRVAERTLDLVIAGIVLGAVAAIGLGWSVRLTRRNRIVAGFASGFAGTTSAIGGPPLAILYRNAGGGTIRSSLGALFSIGLTISLAALYAAGAVTTTDYRVTAWLAVPLVAGYLTSGRLRRFADARSIQPTVLTVSGVAAVALLVRVLAG